MASMPSQRRKYAIYCAITCGAGAALGMIGFFALEGAGAKDAVSEHGGIAKYDIANKGFFSTAAKIHTMSMPNLGAPTRYNTMKKREQKLIQLRGGARDEDFDAGGLFDPIDDNDDDQARTGSEGESWSKIPDTLDTAKDVRITLDCVGKLDDGTVFTSTEGQKSLSITLGGGQMLPGLQKGILGMKVGETKELRLEPSDAFGEHDKRGVQEMPRKGFPEGVKEGNSVQTSFGLFKVLKVDDDKVMVDMNHPLAGQVLHYSVTLRSCKAPAEVEVKMIKKGNGKTFPKQGDKVTMHYTGQFPATGEKFDSSAEHGKPFEFTIGTGQVIEGLDVGIMKMSLGEKATVEVPARFGYGAQGAIMNRGPGPWARPVIAIPQKADLEFVVELLKIN